jgi:hypothetical protein
VDMENVSEEWFRASHVVGCDVRLTMIEVEEEVEARD